MPLPSLIELVPLTTSPRSQVSVPGSKSITNRALVLAALAEGQTVLHGALWSEDTQVMVDCLQQLGFMIAVAPDPKELCNRTVTVHGQGGKVPRGGTAEQPLPLFVGNAGTAARFLTAFVCLGQGTYKLVGVTRMQERPQAALFQALRQLGYRIDSPSERLPAVIHGAGPRTASCQVSILESSQFASALLLCARVAGWTVEVTGENPEESPYVAMTIKLINAFPPNGGDFQVEPDCSSGSYFWAAGILPLLGKTDSSRANQASQAPSPLAVEVVNWPNSGWQVDQEFVKKFCRQIEQRWFQPRVDTIAKPTDSATPAFVLSRRRDLGDSIMTAIVLAPLLPEPVLFTDLGRLRVQECERVQALRRELTRCGAKVVEREDTLTVYPSPLHGAEIQTYNDHRMAMCFAILGLKVPGIKIKDPACVKKTFPDFFQKLAVSPPAGLGALILDGAGRHLTIERLFAD